MQSRDDEVDELDGDERRDDAAQPVDQQIAAKQRGGADGTILDAPQRQRDQRDDDQGVEDDRRQYRRLAATRAP